MNAQAYAAEICALEIISMAQEDMRVRDALAKTGALFDGYHPDMEHVHVRNAQRLDEIIHDIGWPSPARTSPETCDAAWLIVQHAISLPDFQRRMLALIEQSNDVPAWQAAYLADRIRVLEGRPQIYGTQFDWDDAGNLSPRPIENPEGVNERRASVGLGTIEDKTEELRQHARTEGQSAPADHAKRRKDAEDWARKVGWRS